MDENNRGKYNNSFISERSVMPKIGNLVHGQVMQDQYQGPINLIWIQNSMFKIITTCKGYGIYRIL